LGVAGDKDELDLYGEWHGLGAVPWWVWGVLIGSFVLLNVQRVRSKR
jgi:hypothetical protein